MQLFCKPDNMLGISKLVIVGLAITCLRNPMMARQHPGEEPVCLHCHAGLVPAVGQRTSGPQEDAVVWRDWRPCVQLLESVSAGRAGGSMKNAVCVGARKQVCLCERDRVREKGKEKERQRVLALTWWSNCLIPKAQVAKIAPWFTLENFYCSCILILCAVEHIQNDQITQSLM